MEGTEFSSVLREDDIPRLRSALTAARKGSEQQTQRFTCEVGADSENPTVEIELSPVANPTQQGDILGAIHSKTEYRSNEAETADAEWFDHFFDPMDQAVVESEIRDEEPIVRAVNPAFEKKFGYHAGYIIGESLNEYTVPDGFIGDVTALDAEITRGNVVKGVYTRKTASGLRDFYCRCLPIGGDDERQYGLTTYPDVAEDQQSKQHLQVLHRVLRHNLRNELTVVLGMADEIADTTDSAAVEEAAGRITDRVETLVGVSKKARMAQRILKKSQTDTVINVGQTAVDVVSEARDQWPSAKISSGIETALPVSAGFEIRDALYNLLENAITHNTGDPVVDITVRKYTPIHVSTRSVGEEAVITVKDDGPGIPENERAVVFEEEDMSQLKHGKGFGLWVVRWIIESANGNVHYQRSDGWTTIELRLPIVSDLKTNHVKVE